MSPFDLFNNASMMHAAIVHLPIAFALLGVPLTYFLAISRQRTEALRWFTVGFFAITTLLGYLAMTTGHGAMDRMPNDNTISPEVWNLISQHQEMGEKVWGIALVVTVLLALSAIPTHGARQAFVGLGMLGSLVLAVWIAILGHIGGTLVYEHGIGTPAMDRVHAATAAPIGQAGAAGTLAPEDKLLPAIRPIDLNAAKDVSYTRNVLPILKENCEECHNPDKMRGDFDITSVVAMMDGGKKGGPGIVPGKPDESSLIEYIRGVKRPQMPKGEDPLTDDQLHVLRQWIAAGALDDSKTAAAAEASPVPEATPGTPAQASESQTSDTASPAPPRAAVAAPAGPSTVGSHANAAAAP